MMGRKRGQIRFGKYYDFHGNEKFDAQAQTCIWLLFTYYYFILNKKKI